MAFVLNNDHLEERIKYLAVMKLKELDRLQKAQKEVKAAEDSLVLINGAMQDCDFWRGEIMKEALSHQPGLAEGFATSDLKPRVNCQANIRLEEDNTAHAKTVRK